MAYRLAAGVDAGKELEKESDFMFGHECYPLLYEELKQQWNKTKDRVVLLENSGTGKSWFQMYALCRLMLDFNANAEYSFVVRQVGKDVYVYDLENADVFHWILEDEGLMTTVIDTLCNALYFFEPDTKNKLSPMALGTTPSLSTMSQCLDRIKEFKKRYYSEMYFPAWNLEQCVTVGAKCNRSEDAIKTRYEKFGGVLRIFWPKTQTQRSRRQVTTHLERKHRWPG
jgi:hypothetical protein